MNPCISPLSGKRTLSILVVPVSWHSDVAVKVGVFADGGVPVSGDGRVTAGVGVSVIVRVLDPQAANATRLAALIGRNSFRRAKSLIADFSHHLVYSLDDDLGLV
jgi:hypothetical protein